PAGAMTSRSPRVVRSSLRSGFSAASAANSSSVSLAEGWNRSLSRWPRPDRARRGRREAEVANTSVRAGSSDIVVLLGVQVVLVVRVGVERVAGAEEQVAEAERGVLAPHRPALAAGQPLQVGGLLPQDAR